MIVELGKNKIWIYFIFYLINNVKQTTCRMVKGNLYMYIYKAYPVTILFMNFLIFDGG